MTQHPWPTDLRTDRLQLRQLGEADLPVLVREIGRWPIARWLIRVPHPYTPDHGREWLEVCRRWHTERRQFHVVAVPAAGGEMLGAAGLAWEEPGETVAELGYWLAEGTWGRGYGTELARAMLAVGFGALGLEGIHAAARPENRASNRVLEKAGFRFRGLDPVHEMGLRGPPGPANLWFLTREEWAAEAQTSAID